MTTRSRALLAGAAILTICIFQDGAARAQAPAQPAAYSYAIAAQPLGTALKQAAATADAQILFAEADLRNKRTAGLNGRYGPDEAIRRLLDGTGLEASAAGDRVYIVRAAARQAAPARERAPAPSEDAPSRPAEAAGVSGSGVEIGEVVVTGSLIRQSALPSPTQVVDLANIEKRGISNPSELTRALPANAGSEAQVDQLNQPLTSGTAQFNLRNLGLGSTLVLLNGRRQTLSAVASTDGSTFVDINSLVPLIAVSRVEVVKDGGAATYGSDAVGGVVNFITRKTVDRPQLSARYYRIKGADQVQLQGIAGFNVAGGDLVLAASYYNSSTLGTDERSFSRASTFGRPSWHSVSSYGQPGSYFRPSLKRYVPDPNCTNPAFPDSYRTSPTDSFCRFDFSEDFDLLPKEDREQIFATWNGDVGDGLHLNLEAGYARTHSTVRSSPSFPILSVSPIVPASNPNNPFGEDVFFRGRLLGAAYGPSLATFDYDTYRVAGGLDGRFGFGWTWQANVAYSQQKVLYDKPDTLATPLQNALNGLGGPGCNPATGAPGVGPCQYYNPFGSAQLGTGTANSPELIKSLIGFTGLHGKSDLVTLDAVSTGPITQWWGGEIQGALGAQYRHSKFAHDWSALVNAGELITVGQAPDFSGTQASGSVFGELQVPIKDAQLMVSGRYEKYENSFSAFSPKVALLYRPADWLSLRASYSKAFRAPSIYQQVAVQSAQPSVNDGGTFIFVNTQTSGDPDLRPEKSNNFNLGATFRPVRNLELSVDYWGFNYKDLIVKENPQPIIDQARADTAAGLTNTAAQQRVVRDALGNLKLVRLRFVNASSVKTDGVDVTARYTLNTDAGDFAFDAAWTHVNKYDIRIAPGSPLIQGAGSVNFNNLGRSLPKDRLEASASWTAGPQQVTLLSHYVSGYKNDRSGITEAKIDSQTTFDLQYSYTFDRLFGGNSTKLTLGVINLADKKPPVAQLNLGFDPMVADPRGRVLYLGLDRTF